MECEFTVELGEDDPTLAVPWRSPDGAMEYVDLREDLSRIDELSEVKEWPELGEFLRALNAGPFATAKCDAWLETLMDVDDEPYAAEMKCASYVDVFFVAPPLQFGGFAEHEAAAKGVVERIRGAEELRARAEIVVRRVYFGEGTQEPGLYWTVYVRGYGEGEETARGEWGKSLEMLAKLLASNSESTIVV